jgi:hypothetical protein
MNLRQVAVLLGATAGVVGEVRRALVDLDRNKHMRMSGSLPVMFLVGAGVAIGVIAAKPDLRRRIGEWMIGTPAATNPEPQAVAATAAAEAIWPRDKAAPQATANHA